MACIVIGHPTRSASAAGQAAVGAPLWRLGRTAADGWAIAAAGTMADRPRGHPPGLPTGPRSARRRLPDGRVDRPDRAGGQPTGPWVGLRLPHAHRFPLSSSVAGTPDNPTRSRATPTPVAPPRWQYCTALVVARPANPYTGPSRGTSRAPGRGSREASRHVGQ